MSKSPSKRKQLLANAMLQLLGTTPTQHHPKAFGVVPGGQLPPMDGAHALAVGCKAHVLLTPRAFFQKFPPDTVVLTVPATRLKLTEALTLQLNRQDENATPAADAH
jgi:hypothetical protein